MTSTGQSVRVTVRKKGHTIEGQWVTQITRQNLDVTHHEREGGGPRVLHVPDQHSEDEASGRMHQNSWYERGQYL